MSGLKDNYVAVVGAAIIDIGGVPYGDFVAADSNPGRVVFSHGGVGRNIVHNLALMGANTSFVTALGVDAFADTLTAELAAVGVDLSGTERNPGVGTSVYCYICDKAGDMVAAVCDTDACDTFTPMFLKKRLSLLGQARLVVADTNISAEAMRWLLDNIETPLLIDTVSAAKAVRLPENLSGVYAVKPNRIEAQLLTGVEINGFDGCREAAECLLDRGVQRVFITLGADGVWCAEKGRHVHLKNLTPELKGATGAGDAFTAALALAYLDGASLEQSGRMGLAAAATACESASAVNPAMSRENIMNKLNEYGGL